MTGLAPTASGSPAIGQVPAELASVWLDTFGLAATIEWHMQGFRKCTGIHCELSFNDSVGRYLAEEYATAIFHIYHEALSNVARHAAASKVAIDVAITPEAVTMVLSDDGIGIAQGQPRDRDRGGLAEICRRTDSYHGRCSVVGVPNTGTTVTVSLPLGSASG